MLEMSLFEIFCDTAYAEQEIDIIGREKVRPYEMLAKTFINAGVVEQRPNSSIQLADGQLMSEKMFALYLYQHEDEKTVLMSKYEQLLAVKNSEATKIGGRAGFLLNHGVIQ